jgi:hypothetical protein
MNYLKKFESNEPLLDSEYVEMCFIELIEGDRFRDMKINRNNSMDINFNIPLPELKNFANAYFEDINLFTKTSADTHKLYLDIEFCVNKLKIHYPDYKVEYKLFTSGFNPHVFVVRVNYVYKEEDLPF